MLFDKIFDFNGEGNLDWLEKGARDDFVINMINHEEQEDELASECLDYDELSALTVHERDRRIMQAGVDSDNFKNTLRRALLALAPTKQGFALCDERK